MKRFLVAATVIGIFAVVPLTASASGHETNFNARNGHIFGLLAPSNGQLSNSAPLIGSSHGQDVVFGLIVVLVMILLPNGFAGLLRVVDSRFNSAIKSGTAES